jgi:glycosyltransferase involved in cell wall biosynthesis
MRIAILGQYPLDTQRLGGVEVAIVYAQRELLKIAEVELHILTCKEELTQPKVTQQERLTITYLPRGRRGRLTWHRYEIQAMLDVLRAFQPNVVHGHGSGLYAGAALSSPYPSVITPHGIIYQEARLLDSWNSKLRGWLDSAYERSVVRRAHHMMLITPYVEKAFAGVFSGQSYLVENACDERFFDLDWQPVPGRLLFAGPVIPRKGVLPLLKALSLVRREVPTAHVRIAGPTGSMPDYFQTCQAFVREAGLGDAVTFLGHLTQEQVLQEYATCAVFVLPSFQETAPMVVEQAMAAGVPSVATCAGGVPWMLEQGVTGLTLPVPPSAEGDPQALAEALLRLLRDPMEARRMGQRAKMEAEKRFRPEVVARRTYAVYQQVREAAR